MCAQQSIVRCRVATHWRAESIVLARIKCEMAFGEETKTKAIQSLAAEVWAIVCGWNDSRLFVILNFGCFYRRNVALASTVLQGGLVFDRFLNDKLTIRIDEMSVFRGSVHKNQLRRRSTIKCRRKSCGRRQKPQKLFENRRTADSNRCLAKWILFSGHILHDSKRFDQMFGNS